MGIETTSQVRLCPVDFETIAKLSADNLNRAAAVTYQWWINPFAKRLHARCDDPLLQCTCTAQGETDAYTISHQPNINFCPGYFKRPALATALATPEQGAWEYVLAFYSRGKPSVVTQLSNVR